jgi:aminoglycoside phosphotransferase (APT) family kinase protein
MRASLPARGQGGLPMPEGLDLDGVARFLAARVPGIGGPLMAELVAGGRSNLTYYLRTPGGEWVLRRPPLGHVLPTAHDMAREYRVLAALADTDVPVARPLVLCEDPSVTGAPFYVMERRYGVVVHDTLPADFAPRPEDRRRISLALVDTLARLHAVDPAAVGLGDFGRPDGYLARQVRRWGEQWQRSKTRELPALERLRDRLAAAVPASGPPAIVHGDFRLENVMLDADDPGRVVAVFDWEMSTLGDPLSDLGWLLALWAQPDDPPAYHAALAPTLPTLAPGFLTRAELAAAYAARTGRDVAGIAYYHVLGLFKLAVILEGIHARYLAGETVGEGFERFGPQVPLLVVVATDLADRAGL